MKKTRRYEEEGEEGEEGEGEDCRRTNLQLKYPTRIINYHNNISQSVDSYRSQVTKAFGSWLLGQVPWKNSQQPPNVHKRSNNAFASLTGLQTGSATSATLQRENKIMPRRMKSICQVQFYAVLIGFTQSQIKKDLAKNVAAWLLLRHCAITLKPCKICKPRIGAKGT